MSDLYRKSLNKLELDQVLQQLADCASSPLGKIGCAELLPCSDAETVRDLLSQTTAASELTTSNGHPNFSELRDVSPSLERAQMGGTLLPKAKGFLPMPNHCYCRNCC